MKKNDILVFSHLQWALKKHRPCHLMSRFAKNRRIFFVEDPISENVKSSHLQIAFDEEVKIITPHLREDLKPEKARIELRNLINELLVLERIQDFTAWYYTPLALPYTRHLNPSVIVFDHLEQPLSNPGAHPELDLLETELLDCADIVFTESTESLHQFQGPQPHIHILPNGTDTASWDQVSMRMDELISIEWEPMPVMEILNLN